MKKIFILFIFISNFIFSQEDSIGIYFNDEKNINTMVNIVVIDRINNVQQVFEIQNSMIKREILDFNKYDIFLTTKNHIIRFPKIDFISDVSVIDIKFLEKEEIIKENTLSKNKKNYSINFNLGDIYYIGYTRKQIRKLKKITE